MTEQVFCAFLGTTPREDFIPYVADFYVQLEDVQWTIISGIVNDTDHAGAQPRVLAQRRRVRAQVLQRDRQRRRPSRDGQGGSAVLRLALEFLHEHQQPDRKLVKA